MTITFEKTKDIFPVPDDMEWNTYMDEIRAASNFKFRYSFGDLMTLKEWLHDVKCHALIDYDGSGHPVVDGIELDIDIYPSTPELIPENTTHIVWYNR